MAARGLYKDSGMDGLKFANTIKTTGGHGGPPLQYVSRLGKVRGGLAVEMS